MSRRDKVTTKNDFYKRLCGLIIVIVFLAVASFLLGIGGSWIKWIILFAVLAIVLDFVNVFLIKDRFDD